MNELDLIFDYGLNVVNRMMQRAEKLAFDELICASYNVNLDYIMRLMEKYSGFNLKIYANTEKITVKKENYKSLEKYTSTNQIEMNHISENVNVIHSKFYLFKKEGEVLFLAIGSPNFSHNSNQNYESLCFIFEKESIMRFWDMFISSELSSIPPLSKEIPDSLNQIPEFPEEQIKYLEGLWKHQRNIVTWFSRRNAGIVNIPPGTGKTKISMQSLKMIFETRNNYSAIVLVPTITLIDQWKKRIEEYDYECFEFKNNLSDIGRYISNPHKKVIITLYSRFNDYYDILYKSLRISASNIVMVYDECHNLYGKIEGIKYFKKMMNKYSNIMELGLSATLDSFRVDEMEDFIEYMGGDPNKYEISISSFYSNYNHLNDTPILKSLKYIPIKYCLSNNEMIEYDTYSRRVAMQMGRVDVENSQHFGAAIQRAQWLRGLAGGSQAIKDYIQSNIEQFLNKSTIIFVQSHSIAEEIQQFLVKSPAWNRSSSVYIYDSYQNETYREHALEQFRKNTGFCLISERMLSEGFDLPKVDKILLHGSHRSERDWIQKIGRAIRFNSEDPHSIAEILDIVFCEPNGLPLNLEKERYRTLKSISV